MLSARPTLSRILRTAAVCGLGVSQCLAQAGPTLSFTYTSFSVPGAVLLGVESVNDAGAISGYFGDSTGDTRGFLLPSGGTPETLIDPGDTGSPGFTQANQISQTGTVFGEF